MDEHELVERPLEPDLSNLSIDKWMDEIGSPVDGSTDDEQRPEVKSFESYLDSLPVLGIEERNRILAAAAKKYREENGELGADDVKKMVDDMTKYIDEHMRYANKKRP